LECAGEAGADRGHGDDDDDGDQSGDETVFDGRDAGLILDKAVKQITHDFKLLLKGSRYHGTNFPPHMENWNQRKRMAYGREAKTGH
jgi:hypothetical protein